VLRGMRIRFNKGNLYKNRIRMRVARKSPASVARQKQQFCMLRDVLLGMPLDFTASCQEERSFD
jgi:hypothetical protein